MTTVEWAQTAYRKVANPHCCRFEPMQLKTQSTFGGFYASLNLKAKKLFSTKSKFLNKIGNPTITF